MFKSSLQTFYGRHNLLFDRYEIPISQMAMEFFPFTYIFLSSITYKTFTGLDYELHCGCLALFLFILKLYPICPMLPMSLDLPFLITL